MDNPSTGRSNQLGSHEIQTQKIMYYGAKEGKSVKEIQIANPREYIPSILDKPVKCLGKWYDASLKDVDNGKKLKNQVDEGLKKIDKTGLPGKFKAWIYQHSLLSRLSWPLMLYEIPLSLVERRERSVSQFLQKWLAVSNTKECRLFNLYNREIARHNQENQVAL